MALVRSLVRLLCMLVSRGRCFVGLHAGMLALALSLITAMSQATG